jgi:hypothetical protein
MTEPSTNKVAIGSTDAIVAMLITAAGVDRFVPKMWPHHRALYELSGALVDGSSLAAVTRRWKFRASADGGYALNGLERLFVRLTGRGWLVRGTAPFAHYEVGHELRAWGGQLLSGLESSDRERIDRAAQRLKAALSTSSK